MNTAPQLHRLLIAQPTPQSGELMTLPAELLLKIVRYCGLHGTAHFVGTCKAASLFVDEQLSADLFRRELAVQASEADKKKLVSRRIEEFKRRAVRYNDPKPLDQCYDTPLNQTIATSELRPETVYHAAKSRSNLLQLIAEYDADHVLSALVEHCTPEVVVHALLREYGEELTRVKSKLVSSRVGHVTRKTLAQHSQLIGQMLIGHSNITEILPRVSLSLLLTSFINDKKFPFKPRDWLEQCCLKAQDALFDALLTHTPALTRDLPIIAMVINQQIGTRPSSAATAILESAVKHGADVNLSLPDNIPLRVRVAGTVRSPLAIANFGYKGSVRTAVVEWLLKYGARFSAAEVQSLNASSALSAETRALLALNTYVPFTKKGVLPQSKKQYKFSNAVATLLLDSKSFSYSVASALDTFNRERTEYSGTWQHNKSAAQITLSATEQRKFTPRSSFNQATTHVKSCNLTFKFALYTTHDDKVMVLSSGINTTALKLEQLYEVLLAE